MLTDNSYTDTLEIIIQVPVTQSISSRLIVRRIMNISTTATSEKRSFNKQLLVDLYEQHSPGIYRYAYRLIGDQDLAEECVAETFSRFLQAVKNERGPRDNIQGYLYRVAHNWITDQYRKPTVVHDSLDSEEHPDLNSNPSMLVGKEMERERLRAALRKLPHEQQRVIELRFLDELSHEAVASALGKTVEATRALQYRALNSLREMLVEA